MESRRMRVAALALVVALLWSRASASACAGNISIYWGQHSTEASLADTCATGNFGIVIVQYLLIYKDWQTPVLNLANHAIPLLRADIKLCQSSGVKVFLSLDGAVGSAEDAQKLASYLWDNYLGGQSADSPIGDAAFDGIDFGDYEATTEHWDDLAKAVSALSTPSKKVYLSAAPQCPYPDAWLGSALNTGLFDYVWIQFYNNPTCHYAENSPSNLLSAWKLWTESVNTVQTRGFYLGLAASTDEQSSGYIDPDTLISEVLPQIKASPQYGGVTLWTKYADEKTDYSSSIKPYVSICNACEGNISIYWGQHSTEASLVDTCATGNFETVIVQYLIIYKEWKTPVLNLANHNIPLLSADIKSCQSSGVKVFLSLGGGQNSNIVFASAEDAQNGAAYLWNYYLGGNSGNGPLGDAVLDGIDFDMESKSGYLDNLTNFLAAYSSSSKKVYLSAAPQCVYPDLNLDAALRTGLFDYVWIQFYNNPSCQYGNGPSNLLSSWKVWTTSPISTPIIYLGLPAAPGAAGSGYIEPATLISEVLPEIKTSPKYGGVMLWSKYWDEQTGYSSAIKPYVIMKPSLVDVPTIASV